jgi:TolA-binding protein
MRRFRAAFVSVVLVLLAIALLVRPMRAPRHAIVRRQTRPEPASPAAETPPVIDAGAPPATSAPLAAREESDDASMTRLRQLIDRDPARALALSREHAARFPNSPNAAEASAIEVKALALQGRTSEARGAAEIMVNRYPGSHWAREVEAHTGAHPRIDH